METSLIITCHRVILVSHHKLFSSMSGWIELNNPGLVGFTSKLLFDTLIKTEKMIRVTQFYRTYKFDTSHIP